jgi:hypothetical protein
VSLDLITTKEATVMLNVSWQRVQQLVGEGKLGAERRGCPIQLTTHRLPTPFRLGRSEGVGGKEQLLCQGNQLPRREQGVITGRAFLSPRRRSDAGAAKMISHGSCTNR